MAYKILVVDDEYDLRMTITEALEIEGYVVVEAIDGEHALQKLQEIKDVDLILLDQMMPKLTGDQFRKIQQETEEIKDIPVILMTAGRVDPELFYSIKPASYVKKPIDLDLFLKKIEEILELFAVKT